MRILILLMLLSFMSCKKDTKEPTETATDINAETTESAYPPLEIYDFEGIKKYLTTTNDTTYVVNFWATWCAPCIKELPYFERLNSEYHQEVSVVLVSLDFPKNYESNLQPFIKEKELQSKVLVLNDPDSNSWIPKVDESWSGAIPATLIFNKYKRQFYEKTFTYDELVTEVKQFLK